MLACASAPIASKDQRALTDADALVLQGCYDCLLEARGIYDRIGAGRARPLVLERLFTVELLIALREKELALRPEQTLDRARALVKELPPVHSGAQYLELVEAIPANDVGRPEREHSAFMRDHRSVADRVDEHLKWLETGPLAGAIRHYLSLALDCSYPVRPGPPGQPRVGLNPREPPAGAPPIVRYRSAICGGLRREPLERLREELPRFVETSMFLGRLEVSAVPSTGIRKAQALFDAAYARFPNSPVVTYLGGSINQIGGNCRAAVRYYDETLALADGHENALLGRTTCLSYLKQTDEAIRTATRLIELGTYHQGDAYYWRAWNHHQRQELDRARSDSDRAKTLRYNVTVLTLAGMIEHDQEDLQPAEKDLVTAKDLDARNCTAMWYLGLLDLKRQRWPATATHFVDAMKCYDAAARETEGRMQAMLARTDLDPEFKASQTAAFQAAIAEDRGQESAAAYNAAVNFLRAGDAASAATYTDFAARDPARLPKVEELRKLIEQSVKRPP